MIRNLAKIGTNDLPATTDDINNLKALLEKKERPNKVNGKPVVYTTVSSGEEPGFFLTVLGTDDRPATSQDIKDIQVQLNAINDQDELTIVTHPAFQMTWVTVSDFLPLNGMRNLVVSSKAFNK
jgi:hypothetical protein